MRRGNEQDREMGVGRRRGDKWDGEREIKESRAGDKRGDRRDQERGKCDQNMEKRNGSISQGCLFNLL